MLKTMITTLALTLCLTSAHAKDTRPRRPPRGAIVLFNGKDTNAWEQLKDRGPVQWVITDGALEVKPGTGNIITKQEFQDFKLHVEFNEPYMPDKHSQERGNSGVYLQGRYEIQVLDSYNNPTYKAGGCGSIYGQKDPDKNMALPPGQWQTYDIDFRAARLGPDGKVVEKPRVTVIWNGTKVHDNVKIEGGTTAGLGKELVATGPIMLQDHGSKVRFRNIWIVPGHSIVPSIAVPH